MKFAKKYGPARSIYFTSQTLSQSIRK